MGLIFAKGPWKKNLLMFLQPVRLKWSHLLRYEVTVTKWHDCNRCFLLSLLNHNCVSWRKSMFKTNWQNKPQKKIYHCWEKWKKHNTLNNYGVYWLGWKNKLHESVKTALIIYQAMITCATWCDLTWTNEEQVDRRWLSHWRQLNSLQFVDRLPNLVPCPPKGHNIALW